MATADPRRVFGVALSPLSRAQVVAALLGPPPPGEAASLLATLNLDHVVRLQGDAAFRAAYARAALVTADGAPVFAWARLRGAAPPERAPGADLLAELVERWSPLSHRPFFVVSRHDVGEALCARLAQRGFAAQAAGWASPPFGFEHDPAETARLIDAVRAHRPTHLIMGVGAPKSEVWVDAHRHRLGPMWACGFGASGDFLAGAAVRAPRPMQRLGLEWLWRLASDPRRLARRYLWDSWAVLPAMVRDLRGRPRVAADDRVV